jgi:hypothetical protein
VKATILFVYNADSGLFNTLSDIAHKTFTPESYSCNLCAITYGTFGMRAEWKQFLESLGCDLEFLHRNELKEQYSIADTALPAIFLKRPGTLNILITASEINSCVTVEELKQLILKKLGSDSVSQ